MFFCFGENLSLNLSNLSEFVGSAALVGFLYRCQLNLLWCIIMVFVSVFVSSLHFSGMSDAHNCPVSLSFFAFIHAQQAEWDAKLAFLELPTPYSTHEQP